MTDFIDDEIVKEGGYVNNPLDRGGATKFGITLSTLAWWRKGVVTVDDLKLLTPQETHAIYQALYVKGPGFDAPELSEPLRHQLVDFGIMSGPQLAISTLQKILGVGADGVLGPKTLLAISTSNPLTLNNHLLCARVEMLARVVARDPSQATFLVGWIRRVISFLLDPV